MTATAEYEKAKQTPLPKAGDTIRLTIEGKTTIDWTRVPEGGRDKIVLLPGDKVTVEITEPKWHPCDVIACKHGHTYIRSRGGYWLNADGIRAEGPCITDTAVLLIRNGKIVPAAAQS